MYYEDLSLFNLGTEEHRILNTISVGWLSLEHPFPTAEPDENFLKHLFEFCKIKFISTRGFHRCELCSEAQNGPIQIHDYDNRIWLGSAQIRVIGDNKIYASPNMIYHYVIEHSYKPPDEFINSVLIGPQPDSSEFIVLVEMYKRRSFSNTLTNQNP